MNTRRRITGVVTSNKMMKTVVVEITRTYQHPLYHKVVHSRKRVKAHDELSCKVGDHVVIVESQPISAQKHWVVEKLLRRERHAEAPVEIEAAGTEPNVEAGA
jgi:small subunit ribosomal protein S17